MLRLVCRHAEREHLKSDRRKPDREHIRGKPVIEARQLHVGELNFEAGCYQHSIRALCRLRRDQLMPPTRVGQARPERRAVLLRKVLVEEYGVDVESDRRLSGRWLEPGTSDAMVQIPRSDLHGCLSGVPTHAVQPRRPHDAPGRRRLQPLVGQPTGCYAAGMTITARVREGRLVLDEPTTLPEGTQVALLPLDPGDWLDDTDRAALHTALRASDADVAAGRLMDATELLRSLRTP